MSKRFFLSFLVFASSCHFSLSLDQQYPATKVASSNRYVQRALTTAISEDEKLVDFDGSDYDQFGSAVAVYKHVIVVGARYDDSSAGMGLARMFLKVLTVEND